ncbi:GNAT family N-acetyltransferase [Candidatus Gottesmanbacteria bacterium]|nr:GNAT family N-acetyltransferase [Candidatus Gottesmanbacteria bacterium]
MNVTIRAVKESDFPSLSEIYCKSYNPLNIGERWTSEKAMDLLKWLYDKQPDLFFVACDGEKVIGAISALTKPWWDGVHLADGELFVDPLYQGKSVGKHLIRRLFTEAQKKYQAVSWDTITHIVHEHPLKWYKKIGFEVIGHWCLITGDIKKVLLRLQ